MTPVQKLSSIFNDKSQFEKEIAMCGFRLSDGLKEDFKDLQGNGEIDESLLRKYKLISSAECFSIFVEMLLGAVEKEINDKVNIVAEVNLKSDFLYSSIQKLSELIEKTERISDHYPKINLDKLEKKTELFFNTLNIQDAKTSNIIISDDIIEEMVGMGKKMRDVQVTKSVLSELLDAEISDIYMNCLDRATFEVNNTIQRIISENKYILSANFNFSDFFPFLISKKEPHVVCKISSTNDTPKTFDQLFYNSDLVTPCIDILKELDPPLIDTDYNYIGKLKGVFCVWIDEMQRQGIVKHYSDRKIIALLIPTKIKRFSINESMFGKYQKKAEELYRTDIKTKVSNIKLSQNSQNSQKGK